MTPLFRLVLLFALFAFLVGSARAGAIIEGETTDAMLTQTAINNGAYATVTDMPIGTLYAILGADVSDMVEAFNLPYLAPGQQVTGATMSFFLEQRNAVPTINLQLYGLNRVSATNNAPLLSDWYAGTNDSANVLLDAQFITPTTPVNQAATYSGANLASFIQKQYGNAAFSKLGVNSPRYVFFRLSPDGSQSTYNNYLIANSRNFTRSYHPTLSLTISNGITNVAGRLQFSFSLPQNSVTSAGVYNSSTGALIRTLWNNVQYQQGTNYGVWDGKDDSGAAVATGSNYQIKLIYHNVQYVWEGMIGNTSAVQSGPTVHRYISALMDMSIAGGNAYYAVGYNELRAVFHSFAIGNPQVANSIQPTFSDCYSCLDYVAADATRSYWAKCKGGISPSDTYVVALNNSNGSNYTFPKGTVPTGTNQKYTNCIDFDATANQPNSATGLAVQQSGNDLFVSHGNLNLVRVFDKVQGSSLGSFTVKSPGRLATTANGDVWVISNVTPPVIQRYTFASGKATLKASITGLVNPAAVCVSADDSLLLVCDSGSSQQIKAFNNTTGAAAWTYGSLGGMAVNGPNINTNTFAFKQAGSVTAPNQTFLAFQSDNTFWIGDGGNGRVLHFSITGNTLVYIEQIASMYTSYSSTVDLTDTTRVFNTFMEYSVNYSLPPGGLNGSWKMVKNWQAGLPSDSTHQYFGMGNGWLNVVTLSNGRTYGFLNNFSDVYTTWDLFELPASGPARFTGESFKNRPRIYADGTLRYHNTTTTALSYYSEPLTGFDSQNNPIWASPTTIASVTLAATDPKPWGDFLPGTEITASGLVVTYDGDEGDTGYHMGAIPVGGTQWQWRSSPSTPSTYTGWFPQDGHFDIGNSVQYAGNVGMALGRDIVCGYHGEFWKNEEASKWFDFYDNGLLVGVFGTTGNPGPDSQTTMDGFAGNSFTPTLVQAANGKAYLYCNDESNHGGTCRWRIDGWSAITELKATGAIGATANLSPGSTTGPTVTMTSPTASASYPSGSTVTLSATAASSGASIASVRFYDGSTSLGTVSAAPFSLNDSGLSVGSHVLTAVATDSNGLTATSSAVNVTITAAVSNTAPPTPISLGSSAISSQSVTLSWTEPSSSSPPTSYTIQRATGSGSFSTVGTASGSALSFTDTSSLSAGTTYQYKIDAVNAVGSSAYSAVIFVTTTAAASGTSGTGTGSSSGTGSGSGSGTGAGSTVTNFASWLAKYFTASQRNDATISGAGADPYGSGVPNLLAYGLQLNPATARPTDIPQAVISNGHLSLTYLVPTSISDITYTVEVSSDLKTWNSGSGYTQIVSNVSGTTGRTVTVQDSLPTSTQKHFMRLRVTQIP